MTTSGDEFRKIAQDAINLKRSQLGTLVGNPSSGLEVVEGGFESFVQHFDNGLDIYFTVGDSEAHEVHGAIKAKYDTIAPPAFKAGFGLPATDESPAANGGKFNDFGSDKSIYWHPDIGPRLVTGQIRESWKQRGGEGGELGYPVKDQTRWPTLDPSKDPVFLYSIFQNGAIAGSKDGVEKAGEVTVSPNDLSVIVRKQFDEKLKTVDDTLGLDAGVVTVGVSDWSLDAVVSANRVITYRLSGFRSNPVIQDTTFVFDIGLRFRLQPHDEFVPTKSALVVEMLPGSLRVQAFGVGAGALQERLSDGISAALQSPVVLFDPIPVVDPDSVTPALLDLIVTSEAGLSRSSQPASRRPRKTARVGGPERPRQQHPAPTLAIGLC